MSVLKKLAGQTALYGLSSIIGRALNFLLVPFYTSVLLVGEFGTMSFFYAYVSFLNIVYLFGMETAYFRFASKEDYSEQESFDNSLSFVFFSSICLSGLIILFYKPLAHLLHFPDKASYLIWLALILAVDAVTSIPFARLRYQKKAGQFAFAKIFNISLNIGFNLFFLVFCKKIHEGIIFPELKNVIDMIYDPSRDVEYIFISNFIANFMLIPLLWGNFKSFRFKLRSAVIKPMVIYAMPLMVMGLAGMTDEMLSRLILEYVLPKGFYQGRTNLEALGIFSACYKLSMFMTLAIQSFRYAADPFFFSQAQDKNAPALIAKVTKYFIIVCAFIYLFVSVNLSIFELLLRNPVYREGILVVPILLLANLFLGVYYNLSIWYKLTDKTQYGMMISVFGAVLTFILNILLIPYLGYMGSAFTTLICYFSMTAISYFWGTKYYPVPYKIGSAFFYIGLATAFIFAALSYPFGKGNIIAYAFQFCLILIYLLVVFVLERKQLNFRAAS